MISQVSSLQPSQSSGVAKTPSLVATNKPQGQRTPQPSDTVTLKSTSNASQDSDGK
jgi:hypothetical protein